MSGTSTPWKKSRTYGDVYGGRERRKLSDGIFYRAHSLTRPTTHDQCPILIQDNPSRDFFFPISAKEAKEAMKALPKRDFEGITHIWLRRFKKSEYEKGDLPLAEFICGSGVRVIVLYPFPTDMVLVLGDSKPSKRKLKELEKWGCQIHKKEGVWTACWSLSELRKYYINSLLYHEVGHHVDWYNRYWSSANVKQAEEFADQYAIQKTANATHVFNKLEKGG